MKKYLFIAAAALTMMAGCNKYKVEVGNPTNPTDDNSPVEIQVAARTAGVDVKTKAAVDAWTGAEELHIVAMERSTNTVKFDAPATVASEQTTVSFKNDESTADVDESTRYYEGNTVYDFYGYYLGGATPAVDFTNGSAVITIDGTQDVMLAKADPAVDAASSSFTAEMIDQVVYSARAARQNIQPSLVFEHMLTRFEINVKSTDENMHLKELAVSSKAEANLSLIDLSLTATETAATDLYALKYDTTNPAYLELSPTGLTTNLEVMPLAGEASYTFKIYLAQGAEPADLPTHVVVTLTTDDIILTQDQAKPTAFEAGVKYAITFTVYGQSQIGVTATIKDWKEAELNDYDDNKIETTYSLIDGKTLTVETAGGVHTIKSYKEGATDVTPAPAQNEVYYTTKGSIITVGADNTVEFAKAQELKVTLPEATESVKAYHYVTEAALPEAQDGETPGDVIYVTGEPHYGTFTLVYNEETHTVVTNADFVVTSVTEVTNQPEEPTGLGFTVNPDVVSIANDGTTVTLTIALEGNQTAKYIVGTAESAPTEASAFDATEGVESYTKDTPAELDNTTPGETVVYVQVSDGADTPTYTYYRATVPTA